MNTGLQRMTVRSRIRVFLIEIGGRAASSRWLSFTLPSYVHLAIMDELRLQSWGSRASLDLCCSEHAEPPVINFGIAAQEPKFLH